MRVKKGEDEKTIYTAKRLMRRERETILKKKINTDFNVHNSLNHHLNTRTDRLCSYATYIHQQQCMDANTMNRFLSPLYHVFFLFLSLAMSLVCLVCVCMQNPSVHQTFFGECCKANPNCDQIFKSEKRH